jgi:rare lipoprotein A
MQRWCEGETWLQAKRVALVAAACVALANCSSSSKFGGTIDPRYGVASSPRVIEPGQPVPKGGGTYRVGKPYTVAGRMYVPEENVNYRAEGLASWYGDDFHGRLTANGEIYDMQSISAAHPTLPMPSYVRVTNLANKKSMIVRVNDRGPYHSNRVIDLSVKVAHMLGFHGHGIARVRVEYVGRAPLEGSDDTMLVATLRQGDPAPAPSGVMVASAKPFVPDMRGSKLAALRSVPMPPDRPYALSDGEVAPARRASIRDTIVDTALVEDESVFTPRAWNEPAPRSPTASAFAPSSSTSVMSGRGLY